MNEREIACLIALQFEKTKQRLDEIEKSNFSRGKLSSDQIRLLKNLTSGSLRHRTLLDWYSAKLYNGKYDKLIPKVRIILRLGLYEIIFLENIPEHATVNEYVNLAKRMINQKTAKLVNAVLRSFIRSKKELDDKLKGIKPSEKMTLMYSFPEWLIKRWIDFWGFDFTEKLCKAFNQIPQFTVRVNQRKTTVERFKQLLLDNDVIFTESEKVPGYIKVKQIGRIRELGCFEKGLCSVQDESASWPVKLLSLQKGDRFLDVCAAPGGKFTQALEQEAQLSLAVAVDNNLKRLQNVRQNLQRLDLKGYVVAADANTLPFKIKFNKILLDAPCSGQGVIGKHPDIKWRRTASEISEFSNLQKSILEKLDEHLQDSGQLVYSTCSIDSQENEQVVNALSSKFAIKEQNNSDHFLKTFPSIDNMDGSFASILQKKKK